MNAYSEDLRKKKIVEAAERATPKTEVARSFGVGLSSVKRYVAAAREGRSLAPKKRPGSKPQMDETARRLPEADVEERPEATLSQGREFLGRVAVEALAPSLSPGWVVMDDLSAHKKGARVREIVEGRGCELLYLPPYSPNYNTIEQALSKVKGLLRDSCGRPGRAPARRS